MAKNYYLILGVSPDATASEIKSAYRRRAREYHPDRSSTKGQPFLDIQEAYLELSDSARRRAYDRKIQRVRESRTPPGPAGPYAPESMRRPQTKAEPLKPESGEPADLGRAYLSRSWQTYRPSYEELLDRLLRNFSPADSPKSGTVKQLVVEFVLSPEEARRGGNVQIHVPAQIRCPACGGRGGIGYYECGRCTGEGVMTGEFPIMPSYPAGIRDGYQASLPVNRLGIRNLFLTVRFRVGGGPG